MIDRDTVKEYNAKGKKDKEENDEKVELFMSNFDSRQYGLDRTPIQNTPGPYGFGGKSIQNMSPYVYGGAGMLNKSPLFTPMRSYHKQQFTEEYQPDLSVMHSPLAGGQTPLPFNQLGATPLPQSTSPVYNMAYTSNRIGSTSRSPHYNAIFNAASNSPNYSSSLRSHSPDYNTPGSRIGSPGGSPHSPSYANTPLSVQRAPKDEEDDDEDDL